MTTAENTCKMKSVYGGNKTDLDEQKGVQTMREESTQTTRPLNAEEQALLEQKKAEVRAQYGENRKITDGQYDRSLAVRGEGAARELPQRCAGGGL